MNTIRQKVRKNLKKARMTGILQRTVAVILLTILAGSHVAAPSAHAVGILDWLKSRTNAVQPILADQGINQMFLGAPVFVPREASDTEGAISGNALIASSVINHEPLSQTVRQRLYLEVSAYNSEVGQTDDSPFIMANGGHVHDGAVATNILPFGTRVKIPEYFGDKIFTVEDRMNRRYQDHLDVWMLNKSDALSFGRRATVIEVIW